MTIGGSRSIPCKSGALSVVDGVLELRAHNTSGVRIAAIALHDIDVVECEPVLVSCSLRIIGRGDHKLFADGILFGDAIQLIMLLGYSRVRRAEDAAQPDSITVTSLDGRNRLVLTPNTLRYEGQLSWELPLTRILSVAADSTGARSTLLFGAVDRRTYTADALQSSGALRLLLAMAEMLREQPTVKLESSAIVQSVQNSPTTEDEQAAPHPADQVTRTMRMSRKNRRHAPRSRSNHH